MLGMIFFQTHHSMAIGPTDHEKVIAGIRAAVLSLPQRAFWADQGKKTTNYLYLDNCLL